MLQLKLTLVVNRSLQKIVVFNRSDLFLKTKVSFFIHHYLIISIYLSIYFELLHPSQLYHSDQLHHHSLGLSRSVPLIPMHSISNSFQTDCHNSICHVEEGAIIGESLRSIFVDAVPPVPPKGFISTKTKPKHVECSLIPCLKTFFDLNLGGSPSFLLIIKGLTFTVIAGAALGSLMPKNKDLSYTYSYISSIIGYTFCTASIIMLFPQIITNYRSKKVDGLSTDSMIFGFIKSGSYAIYTSCFLWNSTIRQEYKIRNGSDAEITVMSNDVAYTLFTLLLKVIILCQMMCYRGFVMSRLCMFLVAMMTIAIIVYILCIHTRVSPLFNWYDLLYLFATYNTILTFMQYIPQVEMNLERKSTKGKWFFKLNERKCYPNNNKLTSCAPHHIIACLRIEYLESITRFRSWRVDFGSDDFGLH